MRNLKMTVEYDGSAYCGWQAQGRLPTVQKELEECLAKICGEGTRVHGAGRTDAGVHALNQVAHFRLEKMIPADRLLMAMNSILPRDIVVKELVETTPDFHARYHAKSKVYCYRIFNRPIRPVMDRQYAWHVPHQLRIDAMNRALQCLQGTHDFSAFCAAGSEVKDRIRTVFHSAVEQEGEGLVVITLEADGFLRHMVRNIVGTLVEIGKGQRPWEDLARLLQGKDRTKAGITAPAHGLFLVKVKY